MKIQMRKRTIAYCVGLAMGQLGAATALADSGVGVDTALGNALNPPGRSAIPRQVDPEGFDTVRRSPSGQLYGVPLDVEDGSSKTAGGWNYSGGVEVGVIGGGANEKSTLFRKYKDVKNGAYLNYFEVESEKKDSANYVQAFGGGVAQDDQFYGLQFGRYNDWKVKLFYNETIHVFSDTWKSLFNGEGSGNLTTGLANPVPYVDGATHTGGSNISVGGNNYTFAGGTNQSCTAAAPCWRYGSTIFSNATAVAGINGITGTPLVTPGGSSAQNTGAIQAGSAQSNLAKAIADKLAATPETELSLVRKKGGARVDLTLTDFWKGYASYSQEKRQGSRPFAMNEGNVSTEIAEPIDYTTHEFLAGLQYADSLTQANLRLSSSLFRNNISTLNVQYPFLSAATSNGVLQHATFDLYPDNKAFNLKGEFARELPSFYKGRFTAALSWGTNRQDESLLAPISAAQNADFANAGYSITNWQGNNIGYAANSGLISNWNTTAALSQQTAKQRIDNSLVDLGLSLKPTDALSLKGTYRFYQTDNKGGYTAYNPLTGQFGRGIADGNGVGNLDLVVGLAQGLGINVAGNCFIPSGYPTTPDTTVGTKCTFGLANAITSGSNIPVFGQARSTKQTNYGLAADYDLTRTSSLNGSLEREEFKRDFRERDKTWEDKFKLGYVNRSMGDATLTLRASLETDKKRGSDYRYRTFEDLGQGLPGLDINTILRQAGATASTTQAAYNALIVTGLFNRYSYYFRKYDQADRNQNILNTRLNIAPREDMDFGVTLQLKRVDYPDSFYGLEKDNQDSLTLDFNFQPSTERSFYAYYSFQHAKKAMNMNSGIASGTPATACTLANLLVYGYSACSDGVGANAQRPISSAWSSDTDDHNDVLGLGFQREIGKTRFALDYTYSTSTTRNRYNYGNTAINATLATQNAANLVNAAAGFMLPDMTFMQHVLNMNLVIPIDRKLSLRVFDRYEIGRVKDWHYDQVLSGVVANYDSGTLLLDAGPKSYHTNLIGLMLQFKL